MTTIIEMARKMKSPSGSKVRALLLETTIQVHRIAGDPKDKEGINAELKGKALFTTCFVYLEFLRTVIADLYYVYTSVVKEMNQNQNMRVELGALLRGLGSAPFGYSIRRLRRMEMIMASILDEFSETRVSRQRLIRFLERTSEEWGKDFFEAQFHDGGETEIKCLDGLMDSHDEWEELKRFDPFPPPPKFPVCAALFLNSNKENVRKCEWAMRQPKFRDKAAPVLKVLEKMKNGDEYDFLNKLAVTTRGNWWLGDLLIALEAPHFPVLYTNDGLFEALCDALGRKLYDGHMPYKSSRQKTTNRR